MLFMLSIPGLAVLLLLLGAIEMTRAKYTGRRPRGVGAIGFNALDMVFHPGSEHKLTEVESKRLKRKTSGDEAPPREKFEIDGRKITFRLK